MSGRTLRQALKDWKEWGFDGLISVYFSDGMLVDMPENFLDCETVAELPDRDVVTIFIQEEC